MRDLRDTRLMLLKAILFVAIGGICVALLLLDSPTLKTAALLALCIWAFARAYYFAFYVITHYVDPSFKYSGVFSAIRHSFSLRRPR